LEERVGGEYDNDRRQRDGWSFGWSARVDIGNIYLLTDVEGVTSAHAIRKQELSKGNTEGLA